MINEREEINQTNNDLEECDHEWQFDTCDGETHWFYCLHCDEELTEDCDCEPDEEDEDDEETA